MDHVNYFELRKRKAWEAYLSTLKLEYLYTIVDETYAVLLLYTGQKKNIVVPSAVNGFPVREIAASCFNYSGVTSVIIPSCVTKIG